MGYTAHKTIELALCSFTALLHIVIHVTKVDIL